MVSSVRWLSDCLEHQHNLGTISAQSRRSVPAGSPRAVARIKGWQARSAGRGFRGAREWVRGESLVSGEYVGLVLMRVMPGDDGNFPMSGNDERMSDATGSRV